MRLQTADITILNGCAGGNGKLSRVKQLYQQGIDVNPENPYGGRQTQGYWANWLVRAYHKKLCVKPVFKKLKRQLSPEIHYLRWISKRYNPSMPNP
ncbi:MAG: hypothetical protein QXV01_11085 [Candidatus Bathyarchaeia archaeon]